MRGAFIQEFRALIHDGAIILTIIGGVLLYAFLYPQPYVKGSLSNIKLVVVNQDKTDLSEKLLFALEASANIQITAEVNNLLEAKRFMQQREANAIMVVPYNFKQELLLHEMPQITIWADGSYMLIFGGVMEATLKTVLGQNMAIKASKLLANEKLPLVGVKDRLVSFKMHAINLFNADNSYTQYVVPAVFVLILQQTMLIGLGIFGGGLRERAYGGYDYAIPFRKRLFARYILFMTLFTLHFLFYFGWTFNYFHITHFAHAWSLLGLGVLFLHAVFLFGVFLGSFMPNRERATPIILLSSLPLVFSAGFVWPQQMMPFMHLLSSCIPSTPAIEAFLKLNQMGASLSDISVEISILLLQIVIYATVVFFLKQKYVKNIF